jgi:hypothetical protein
MTRPMTEADVLAAAQARISRPSAERDVLAAVLHLRRLELGGVNISDDRWSGALLALRDAADRLIEVDAYQVAEAASEQIVREAGMERVSAATLASVNAVLSQRVVDSGDPVYDLPCGHTVFDACEACTPDPDAQVFDLPGPLLENRRAEVARRRREVLAEMTRQAQADGGYDESAEDVQAMRDHIREQRIARRYDQCDEMCTTDCGHCKGNYAEVLQARALTTHEAGVDAFVSRPEFGGAK